MEKIRIFKIVFILIIITIIIFIGFNYYESKNTNSNNGSNPVSESKISGNSQDLVYFSVSPGDSVSGILDIVGSVKGGYFFEGNILVNILDVNKKVILKWNGTATTDWATIEPVSFTTTIDVSYLPKGPAYIEIHNDNPGAPTEGIEKNILIPIIIN